MTSARRKKFLIFGAPQIEKAEIAEVVDCLKTGWLGTGPKVQRFENQFRRYKHAAHAVALNSCTAALHLSMLAAGIGPGDEVIVPVLTFAATGNAVIHAGATPVFVDCDRRTMNMSVADLRRKISRRTRAILPVHFAGRPCEMDEIGDIARKNRLKVIEDCAHAIETEYRGRPAGTMGDAGCFSFYVTKNVVTGEGGMVTTHNRAYADAIKVSALHGLSRDAWMRFSDKGYKHYQVVTSGFKYNMTDLQAALGLHQLRRVKRNWERRRQIWDIYNRAFAGLPVATPAPPEKNTRHALHLYTLLIDIGRAGLTRDQFIEKMGRRNIGTGVHYIALHLHSFYRKRYGYRRGDFPNAEWISERTVSLPLSPKLTDGDVRDVVHAVRGILS